MVKKAKGFTLIEVLFALALLGILAISALPAIGSVLKQQHRSVEGLSARLYAESIIEDLAAKRQAKVELPSLDFSNSRFDVIVAFTPQGDMDVLKVEVHNKAETEGGVKLETMLPQN